MFILMSVLVWLVCMYHSYIVHALCKMYSKRFITFHFSSDFFPVNDLPVVVGNFAYIAPSETE